MSSRMLAVGFVLTALCLVLPILWPAALVIGIIAIVRKHTAAGTVMIVLSLVLAIVGSALVVPQVVKPYRMPSLSMVPTLHVRDRFLIWRLGGDPHVGDIVVFNPPQGAISGVCGATGRAWDPDQEKRSCPKPTTDRADTSFVKRVVAGPGDRVAIEDGRVILNGRRQIESFTTPCAGGGACNLPKEITIPPGEYFMMGDNRGQSDDSRYWGPVPSDWIKGRAFVRYWPLKDIGGL